MPSPIAHFAVAYAVSRRGAATLGACLFLSVVPDLDFVLGYLFHDMLAWHNNFSHSLMACLAVALVAGTAGGLVSRYALKSGASVRKLPYGETTPEPARLRPSGYVVVASPLLPVSPTSESRDGVPWRRRVEGRAAGQRWFLLAMLLYGLHLLMDFLCVGRGMMLFWPFTRLRFSFMFPIFFGVKWSDGMVSIQHFWTLLNEVGFVLIVVLCMWLVKRVSARQGAGHVS